MDCDGVDCDYWYWCCVDDVFECVLDWCEFVGIGWCCGVGCWYCCVVGVG